MLDEEAVILRGCPDAPPTEDSTSGSSGQRAESDVSSRLHFGADNIQAGSHWDVIDAETGVSSSHACMTQQHTCRQVQTSNKHATNPLFHACSSPCGWQAGLRRGLCLLMRPHASLLRNLGYYLPTSPRASWLALRARCIGRPSRPTFQQKSSRSWRAGRCACFGQHAKSKLLLHACLQAGSNHIARVDGCTGPLPISPAQGDTAEVANAGR